MRDLPGLRHLRQLLLLAALATTSVVALFFAGAAGTTAAHAAGAQQHHAKAKKPKPKKKHLTPAQRRRQELRRKLLKNPSLTLDSSFIRRLQAAGAIVPFTIRLQRPYEGGAGNDVLELTWDNASEPWPLTDTLPPSAPTDVNLTGALSYEWDFSADTSGYSTLGTIETVIGGGISLASSGTPPYPIAAENTGLACPGKSIRYLNATGLSFTSAGVRFGIVNPFSGDVSGTMNLRAEVRSVATDCNGDQAAQVATTTGADPPLPVAFNGKFSVSPGVTSDGYLRLGVLKVDAASMPQRSVFGYLWSCTVPNGTDTCNRQRFPVRTTLKSLDAEVLVGDHMPGPPVTP